LGMNGFHAVIWTATGKFGSDKPTSANGKRAVKRASSKWGYPNVFPPFPFPEDANFSPHGNMIFHPGTGPASTRATLAAPFSPFTATAEKSNGSW